MVHQKLRRRREFVYRSQPDRAVGMSASWYLGNKEFVGTRRDVQRHTKIKTLVILSEAKDLLLHASLHKLMRVDDCFDCEAPRCARNDKLGRRFPADVINEPITRKFRYFLQRARLFKKVCRAWDDLEFHFAAHPIACLLV